MEQIALLTEQVRRKYALQNELLRLTHQAAVLDRRHQSAVARIRFLKAALEEYKTAFSSRPAVSKEDFYRKVEDMAKDIFDAESCARTCNGDCRRLEQEIAKTQAELATLEGCEERLVHADPDPARCRRRNIQFLCHGALPALEESRQALTEYQGKFHCFEDRQLAQTATKTWCRRCRELMAPLEQLLAEFGIPFELKGYYRSPAVYLFAAATEENKPSPLNEAIDQNLAYQKQLRKILSRLED